MSYQFYKVLHILGLVLAAGAIGAVILQMQLSAEKVFPKKKFVMIAHGIGMLFLLVAGFGLMARTGIATGGWPPWIHAKLLAWFLVGASPTLAMKAPKARVWVWWFVPLILLGAIYSVVYKVGT
jgi:hypothetical protein